MSGLLRGDSPHVYTDRVTAGPEAMLSNALRMRGEPSEPLSPARRSVLLRFADFLMCLLLAGLIAELLLL